MLRISDICLALRILLLLFGVFAFLSSHAQFANDIFRDTTFYSQYKTNRLGFELSPFFRNNEYFEGSQDGQTYIGYQAQMLGFLKLSAKAEIQLGVLATQNYGSHNGFSNVQPVASIFYHNKNSTFIAGTLKGAAHHQLIEPLYQIERFYTDRNENGFQFINHSENHFFDAWLDWETNTNRNIPRQEVFTTGFNLRQDYNIFKESRVKEGNPMQQRDHILSFHAQLLYNHRGTSNGSSNEPLKTLINSGIGIEYRLEKYNLTKWKIASYGLDYRDLSITPTGNFLDGFGHYHHLQFSPNSKWDFIANYWEGTEWISSIGGAVYQAVNPFDRRYPNRKMQLIFARAHYHLYLQKGLMIDLRFDPYYDINQQNIDPSYSLNIKYTGLFF